MLLRLSLIVLLMFFGNHHYHSHWNLNRSPHNFCNLRHRNYPRHHRRRKADKIKKNVQLNILYM